jgi:hypothetical protein
MAGTQITGQRGWQSKVNGNVSFCQSLSRISRYGYPQRPHPGQLTDILTHRLVSRFCAGTNDLGIGRAGNDPGYSAAHTAISTKYSNTKHRDLPETGA